MPVSGTIQVSERYCKGCALCIPACPKDVIALAMDRLTAQGYHPAFLAREGCTGCALCAVVCPDAAISVFRDVPIQLATA